MNKIRFKSTREVIVDPRTMTSAIVNMRVINAVYTPAVGYDGVIEYFYETEELSNDVGGELATFEHKIEFRGLSFSVEEVEQIEAQTGPATGDTFNDKFNDLIIRASMIEFAAVSVFGLTGAEWELVDNVE